MQYEYNFEYLCRGPNQGFKVMLHNPAQQPRASEDHVIIQFGSLTTIKVLPQMTRTGPNLNSYSPIKRKCYFTHERFLRFFKIYTKSNCELECLTNYTLAKCGCVKFDMPREKATSVCDINQSTCYIAALYDVWDLETDEEGLYGGVDDKNVSLNCNCLPTCTELNYEMDVTHVTVDWVNFLVAFELPLEKLKK